MKFIYETLGDTIRKAVFAADANNRRIARVEVSLSEAQELAKEFSNFFYLGRPLKFDFAPGEQVGTVYGVQIVRV